MDPIRYIREKAKNNLRTVILAEPGDSRVLEAGFICAKTRIAKIIFLGDEVNLRARIRKMGRFDKNLISVIDPKASPELSEKLSDRFYQKRRHKNPDRDFYSKIIAENYVYFAAMAVDAGLADGFVAGAAHTTSDVAKAAIYCLGVDEKIGIACGSFIIYVKNSSYGDNGLFVFADCGLMPEPDAVQLAGIAVSASRLYKGLFEKTPYVALLSYSTKGSASGPMVDKIRAALFESRRIDPGIFIDGEFQVDTALDLTVASRKTKLGESEVAGRANVLIFPNLDSGNIGYKLVQRLARARAVGPLLLGLNKPCSDLSRGCYVDDIVDAVAVTAIRALG